MHCWILSLTQFKMNSVSGDTLHWVATISPYIDLLECLLRNTIKWMHCYSNVQERLRNYWYHDAVYKPVDYDFRPTVTEQQLMWPLAVTLSFIKLNQRIISDAYLKVATLEPLPCEQAALTPMRLRKTMHKIVLPPNYFIDWNCVLIQPEYYFPYSFCLLLHKSLFCFKGNRKNV